MSIINSLANTFGPFLPAQVRYLAYRFLLKRASGDLAKVISQCMHHLGQEEVRIRGLNRPIGTVRPLVFGMVGLPFTGKTTVAEVMSQEAGLVHINSNIIRGWLIDVGLSYAHIDAIALCMIESALRTGLNVVFDSDNLMPSKRALLEAIVTRHGGKTGYVAVSVDRDVVYGRIQASSLEGRVHRMYLDGIRGNDPTFVGDHAIPAEVVHRAVCREYNRQVAWHACYGETFTRSVLDNNGEGDSIRARAAALARRELCHYGDEETRHWLSKRYDLR